MSQFSSGLRASSPFSRENSEPRFVTIDVPSEQPNSFKKKFRKESYLFTRMYFVSTLRNYGSKLLIFVLLLFLFLMSKLFLLMHRPSDSKMHRLLSSNRFLHPPNYKRYPFSKLDNLIMVAGHSVYVSTKCTPASNNDAWFLEPYQKQPDQAKTFLDHIRIGVEKASYDPRSLLVFSGGETRKNAGPRTEAQSYWFVAEAANWFGLPRIAFRTFTEEFARDSFENLLFSVCRFRELTGKYPKNITVISYDFKESRFRNLHRAALHFPSNRFFYFGTPYAKGGQESAVKAEKETLSSFESDPYGCFGTLEKKRRFRDPFLRFIPYPSGCPEMAPLFTYCGTKFYSGKVPW